MLASSSLVAADSAAGLTRQLSGHIPFAIESEGMKDAGKLDETKSLNVLFQLKLNNEAGLDEQIAEIYRPGSPTYHQFLTPETFRSKYSPTDAQIAKERAFLEAQGIHITALSDSRVFLHAQATVANLNRALQTELHQFNRANGKTIFAPTTDPRIPANSQIAAVIGLSNLAKPHPQLRHYIPGQDRRRAPQPEGSAPGGGFAPPDIKQAYEVPAGADGTGQTLALFELDGYAPGDITAYEQQFNLPQAQLQNIFVDGAAPDQIGDGTDEVTLDVEMMVALAPGAKILVYEGPIADDQIGQSFETGYLDVMQKIADDNLAHVISTSWGTTESNFAKSAIQAESVVYKQMVAQGQTVYAAAGDRGSEDDGSTLSVQNPASQPNVISVGGTTLTISSTADWTAEVAWNSDSGAGGGGISTVWSIPSWQTSAIAGDSQASTTMRNVPDVSLNSDAETGYGVYLGGSWTVIGGTSAAAPLWAAFHALVNQQRAANSLTPTGFLAEPLYAIGQSSAYTAGFHDITSGSIGSDGQPFSAFTGYDNATGWGTFHAGALIQELAKDPLPSLSR